MGKVKINNWKNFLIDIADLVGGFFLGVTLVQGHFIGILISLLLIIGSFYYKFKNNYY